MNVRELLTKWGFDIEHEKLDKTEKQLEAIKHRLDFIAGVEVVKAMAELTERFAHFAEELHVAAISSGVTVEAFQKMSFAAAQSAVSQEELETSMARLNKSVYAARHGSDEAMKSFAMLGIDGDQLRGFKNAQDAMFVLADRLKNMKDPMERAALAQQVLGRGSFHMVGFLSQGSAALRAQGSEAAKLGIILGPHQVENLIKLEHSLQKLYAMIKAVGAIVASQVAPSFKFLVDDVIKFFNANRKLIDLNVANWLYNVLYGLGVLWGAFKIGILLVTDFASKFGFEGKILSMIGTFGSLIGTLLLVKKVGSLAHGAIQLLINGFMFLMNPVVLVTASLIGIIVAFHDLYEMLFLGVDFKKTWIGKFLDSYGLVEKMYNITDKLADAWVTIQKGGGSLTSIAEAIGLASPVQGNSQSVLSTSPGGNSSNVGGSNYNVNAPITVNVPPGTHPDKVGEHVQTGVREHMDRVHREISRSTGGLVAY